MKRCSGLRWTSRTSGPSGESRRRISDAASRASVTSPGLNSSPDGGRATSGLVDLEVLLAGAADRAEPVVRDVLEGRAGRDAPVGVTLGGVVDESTRRADPLLRAGCCGLVHGAGRRGGGHEVIDCPA